MTNSDAKAREIVVEFVGIDNDEYWRPKEKQLGDSIAAALRAEYERGARESHYEIAQKQADVRGESVMLCGKLVTNEGLYKQPTDYVKEADAAGYKRGKAEGYVEGQIDGKIRQEKVWVDRGFKAGVEAAAEIVFDRYWAAKREEEPAEIWLGNQVRALAKETK